MVLRSAASAGGTSTLVVNGAPVDLDLPGTVPLLVALRNDLGLHGPKYGCGLGQCGACTVLVDGVPARACILPLAVVRGRRVTTLEGLAAGGRLHPVQQAFVDEQAAQCGYCLNGMIMTTVALLARQPSPTEAAIRRELAGNLCRCGTHVEILRAVRRAAAAMREAHSPLPRGEGAGVRGAGAAEPPPSRVPPDPHPLPLSAGERGDGGMRP